MKRILLVALCIFIFAGCGSDGKTVQKHTVTPEEMVILFGPGIRGYTVWDDDSCDIFVFAESEYHRLWLYHETLGHELRHCFEGHWHE